MTDELKDLIHEFLEKHHPEADLADATIAVGIVALSMITASVPREEQQHVFTVWREQINKAWPRLRAITNQDAG